MSSPRPAGLSHAALLEHVEWIRRLAAALVADQDLAEDLVQQTCVVALECAPMEPRNLRQWLAVVLHNLLRQHVRAGKRRELREALRAQPEVAESEDELLERVKLQRELVDAVLALDELYRTVILLRFFRELPPREIARRQGVPIATVNSRLQRGLRLLRRRLDASAPRWALGLGPLLRGPGTLFPLPLAVMKTKVALTLLLSLCLGAWWLWPRALPALAEGDGAARTSLQQHGPAGGGGARTRTVPARAAREPRVPARDSAPEGSATVPHTWVVRARVLDAEARPLAGVALRTSEEPAVLATSGSDGRCTFEHAKARIALMAADPRLATVRAGASHQVDAQELILVVAPAGELAGVVLDEHGLPLAGARVRLDLPRGFDTRFADALEGSLRAEETAHVTGVAGDFLLPAAPLVDGARLSAVRAGFERAELELAAESRVDLTLVLRRSRMPVEGTLRGVVLDGLGVPLAGARVGLGLASTVSDEQGEFALALARAVTADTLVAVKAGYQPGRLERPGEPDGETSGWSEEVVLVLGAPALSIRGVVQDHERKPVPGAKVWLHDPTPAAPIGRFLADLETLMAGAALPSDALEQEASPLAADGGATWTTDDMPQEPSAAWNWVRTDADGEFQLTGLEARDYRLDVLAPGVLAVATSQRIPAGSSGAVVRLDPPDVWPELAGRVVTEQGLGLEGVQLFLVVAASDRSGRVFGGTVRALQYEPGGFGQSGADGRFSFANVPRRRARLLLRGESILPTTVDVDAERLEIVAESRVQLELEITSEPQRFDRFGFAAPDGERLDVLYLSHGSSDARRSGELVAGRSGVVSASSRARTLLLFKDGAEVERLAIRLVPGEVNRIGL